MAANPEVDQAKGASSLVSMAQEKVLNDLKSSIAEHGRTATFACGGSIPFKGSGSDNSRLASTDPTQIRFGEQDRGIPVTLPADTASSKPLQQLLAACTPASFGRGGDEVVDEDYRKAGKLDSKDFTTNFCPYQNGIIDVVSQLLLPNATGDKNERGVKAELYKLNVYSAPSGKFKAHVDTPRSDAQFGSLVVALPVAHEDGGRVTRSTKSRATPLPTPSAIKWAAFYSDCEHEVLEVTAGHRVTLTYNLYVTLGSGNLAGHTTPLDPTQLPIYETLKAALETPGFLQGGRVLGIWLAHGYAHTNMQSNFLPSSLKGADMVLFEAARALNLHCYVRPIVPFEYKDYERDDYERVRCMVMKDRFAKYVEGCGVEGDEVTRREVIGQWSNTVVGTSKITWLNKSRRELEEPAMGFVTCGINELSVDTVYSAAAMLIRIPPFHERDSVPKDAPKSMFDGITADKADDKKGNKDDDSC